jgi:two-component system response regulator AtoC
MGESGTGKDLIARRLHELSSRAASPFLPINCATLPEPLLESELFGYERGAFTGAERSREGLFETAHGGTVFLDEIGELPLALQAKLLRVLEDHTFRRVGGARNISVDLRVIGATNRDLEKAIEQGSFRSDLFYRLNVVQIRLPALRERPEDIPLLAEHFLKHFSRLHLKPIDRIHPAALRLLRLYAWPGNVRELRNVIERAVLVESGTLLSRESLAIPAARAENKAAAAAAGDADAARTAHFSLLRSEHDLITAALAQAEGNQTRAASLLGIGRFSLRYKMKKLGML